MNFFQRIGHALSSFFGSPRAQAVEKALIAAALPVAEQMAVSAASKSPAGAVVVSIAETVIAEERPKQEGPSNG